MTMPFRSALIKNTGFVVFLMNSRHCSPIMQSYRSHSGLSFVVVAHRPSVPSEASDMGSDEPRKGLGSALRLE